MHTGLQLSCLNEHFGHGLHGFKGYSDLFLVLQVDLLKLGSWHDGIEDNVQMAKSKSRWNWKMGLELGSEI
ncbi:unnamed protein product [Lathyrus oleraceus]